jgi:hypothetical protein
MPSGTTYVISRERIAMEIIIILLKAVVEAIINESVQDAKNAAGDCCISGDLEGWVNFGKKVEEREAVVASECLLSHCFPLLRQVLHTFP